MPGLVKYQMQVCTWSIKPLVGSFKSTMWVAALLPFRTKTPLARSIAFCSASESDGVYTTNRPCCWIAQLRSECIRERLFAVKTHTQPTHNRPQHVRDLASSKLASQSALVAHCPMRAKDIKSLLYLPVCKWSGIWVHATTMSSSCCTNTCLRNTPQISNLILLVISPDYAWFSQKLLLWLEYIRAGERCSPPEAKNIDLCSLQFYIVCKHQQHNITIRSCTLSGYKNSKRV